jgi:hypothetical protein
LHFALFSGTFRSLGMSLLSSIGRRGFTAVDRRSMLAE